MFCIRFFLLSITITQIHCDFRCLSIDTRQTLAFRVRNAKNQRANGEYVSKINSLNVINGEPLFSNGQGFCSWFHEGGRGKKWILGQCKNAGSNNVRNIVDTVDNKLCPYNIDCTSSAKWTRGSESCKERVF